jgi:NADH:ubiquinone oxidoreductase subunit 5 (subunit L)/multisubunit Na+/H+ antiporter MnhA subunit
VQMGTTRTGAEAALWPLWFVAALFGSALTLASFVKILHSVFLSRLPERLSKVGEVPPLQTFPMLVLASLCVLFGVFYTVPLYGFILPALGTPDAPRIFLGTWDSRLATLLLLAGVAVGVGVLALSAFRRRVRAVPTWTCGEIQPNDEMIIPGTHFYKTVSGLGGLRQMYRGQERGYFDLYNQSGKAGLALTGILKWMHSGILPVYLTWVMLGLLLVLFVVCGIW